MGDRAQSVIVTGCNPWTLYEYSNYKGKSMCVYPENTSKCSPGFYSTRQSLGSLAGTVSSVRGAATPSTRCCLTTTGSPGQANTTGPRASSLPGTSDTGQLCHTALSNLLSVNYSSK